ncbi:MAG: hypothetical protein ABIF19_08085 [Planctomycetota bacterium]
MAKAKKKTIKKVTGKNGLGVIQTWVKLFEENPKHKLTDEQISKAMHTNFPGRESAIFDHPGVVRTRYNAGLLTKGQVPKVRSVRYDEKGQEVSGRKAKVKKVVKKTKKTKKSA